ncbi:MAG: glycosyltransferase family protein [Desulfopila sp.]
MNILYGVQTTGNGHIIRSKAMIQALQQRGHDVHALLSGCTQKKILDVTAFHSVERKNGLTFVVENGRIRYLKTAFQLNFLSFYKDITTFDGGCYDLVITDYEPITARIATRNKIPSIGIGHLYAFQHRVPIARSNPFPKLIMNHYAPAKYPLGLHWHHFDQPILPPTIPEDILHCSPGNREKDHYLVYLPFEDVGEVVTTLAKLPQYTFRIYANVERPRLEGRITILPFSRDGFIKDLAACRGVICNAGFSFISEALHLGKKILTKAVVGQLEQQSNALALEHLQLGTAVTAITPAIIERWMSTSAPSPLNFPNVIPLLVDWITSESYDDYNELIAQAWGETSICQADLQEAALSGI